MLIRRSDPWVKQPPANNVQVASKWLTPSTRVVNCALNREIVKGAEPSINQGSQAVGAMGVGSLLTTLSIKAFQTGSIAIGTGDFTLLLVYELKTAEAGGYAYVFGTNQATVGLCFSVRHSNTANNADILISGTHINTGISASAAGLYRVCISRKAGQLSWSINGQTGSTTNSGSIATFNVIALNSYLDSAGYGAASAIFNLAAVLPYATDVVDLGNNPWQIFEPYRRTIIVPSGAGGTAVYPSVGHGAFAGYSPAVSQTANQSVSPNTDHGAFTGHAPTVTVAANITVSPFVGHGSFTGKQPTVQQTAGQVVAPNTGHGLFAGHSPAIVQPHTVSPGTGHEAFAGYAPTVTITAGQIIYPSVVHAVFSGKSPTVIRTDNHSISPTSGHGLFYGKRPTVSTASVVYVRAPNGNGSEVIINNTKRQQNISKQLRPANVGGTRH